ncbi:peptide-binding protein [Candidatus Marinamargulisbacteria bacterium SCGC AG-410-N11]|nr:peptide-binding protein [Candidatus Marinamargulisbacteria bacterium SCGC AG-410-N11]
MAISIVSLHKFRSLTLKKTIFYITLILISFSLFLTSCSDPQSTSLKSTDTLYLRLGGEPTYLNPILSTDSPSSSVEGYIYSGLFKVNPDLELEPDLITHYDVSNDKKTFVFYLRKNVKWQDNTPLTAHDVKFTFDKILDKTTNTVRRSNYVIDGEPIQFNVLDPYTFQVILPKPFAPFLIHMTMGIIPKHIFEKEDINKSTYNRNPIGCGPYQFKEWESGQYVKLVRNPLYYDKKPKIKTILMKIIPDANTALVSLEKGEIDQMGIPAKDYNRYKDNSSLNIFRYYGLSYTYMGFNIKNPIFDNILIRKAITLSIDRTQIVNSVLKGLGKQSYLPSSPVLWSYPDDSDIIKIDYNPKLAKKLLKDQGYTLNSKTKILEKDGVPFQFKIITNKGNKDREKTAQIIQHYLKEIGIDVSIQLLEWSSFIKIVNEQKDPKDYDAVILGWGLGLDPDAYSIWHSSQYPKGFNFIGYKSSQSDSLIERGRLELDKVKRKEIYTNLYKSIVEDYPYVFLYIPESIVAINKRVKGLSKSGPGGLMNPIENIYLENL